MAGQGGVASPHVRMETRADGSLLVWQDTPLAPWPRTITERLMHWARTRPDATWLAERGADGASWQRLSYAQGAQAIRAVGTALLDLGLSADRPLLILSGNSVAHALMALGAQHAGLPSAALAPAYALSGNDRAKLTAVVAQLTPGAVFADHAARFLPAISATLGADVPLICQTGGASDRRTISFDSLLATEPSPALDAAHAAITGDTVAKFLFTSGTTGSPKAVIQTHGMLCSNQAMVAAAYGFTPDDPPVLVDWAPWNHTASGNKVFNMAHYNGGTYYIDEGRPTPDGIGRTIANLRDIAPTWYFNVPVGFQFLLEVMERDDGLAAHFLSRLKLLMYAGAAMSQPLWDRVSALAARHGKPELPFISGLGATETGPFAVYYADKRDRPGLIGIPAQGVTLKLVPQDGKLEARVRSPSVTPGYWRNPALTAAAFDDEGFYRMGDALRFVEPGNPDAGFEFDGRLAENFKLATGTWVAVGTLRAALVNDLGGLVSDAVIAGELRDDLRALLVPNWDRLRGLAGVPGETPAAEVAAHPAVSAELARRLTEHARAASGSATRVVAVRLLTEPLDFDKGEVTDKGSVNQRAVLRERADLAAGLWSADPAVIRAEGWGA